MAAAECPARPGLPLLTHAALRVSTAATQSQAATCPPTASTARLRIATRNGLPSAALVPPASSREEARDPLGPSATYHHGPHGPQASSCPGTHDTHRPGHPEPRDDRGHQKEKQQSHRPKPPSAATCGRVQGGRQATLGTHSQPSNPWPLKEVAGKLRGEDAWLPVLHHYSSGASAGGAGGKRDGEEKKRRHIT